MSWPGFCWDFFLSKKTTCWGLECQRDYLGLRDRAARSFQEWQDIVDEWKGSLLTRSDSHVVNHMSSYESCMGMWDSPCHRPTMTGDGLCITHLWWLTKDINSSAAASKPSCIRLVTSLKEASQIVPVEVNKESAKAPRTCLLGRGSVAEVPAEDPIIVVITREWNSAVGQSSIHINS